MPLTLKTDKVKEKIQSHKKLEGQEQQRFDEITDLLNNIDARFAQFPIISTDLVTRYVAYGTLDVDALRGILDVLISWDEIGAK